MQKAIPSNARTDIDLNLERNSQEPLHRQITRQLKNMILEGNLSPDTCLPPQMQLAEDLAVHRLTVRKAYAEMEREGLVAVRKGMGTFVRHHDKAKPKMTVALCMPTIEEVQTRPINAVYCHEITAGIEEYCRKNNIQIDMVMIPSEELESSPAEWLERISRQSGAVLVSTQYVELARRLERRGTPAVVCLGTQGAVQGVTYVTYDRRAAMRQVVEHLHTLGRKRVGYIDSMESPSRGHCEKFWGYIESLETHSLCYDPTLRIDCSTRQSQHEMYRIIRDAIKEGRYGDALVCSATGHGTLAVDVLNELGIDVPDRVAVVGYDESGQSHDPQPSLTNLVVPRRQIGRTAAKVLLERIADPHLPTEVRYVEAELTVRESTVSR